MVTSDLSELQSSLKKEEPGGVSCLQPEGRVDVFLCHPCYIMWALRRFWSLDPSLS